MLAYAFVAGMFGGLLGLPEWALDLSPFGVVPAVPAAPARAGPLLLLAAVAAALVAAVSAGLRRRDLTGR